MHPVLFQLHTPFGNHPIYAYGLMLGLAVLAGWYVMHLAARRLRIDERVVENAYAFGALAALVGGRLAYVAANRAAFPTLLDALMPMHGGLLGPGAFAAGALAAHLVARRAGVSSLRLADAAAPAFAVALILVRIGCYMYGCDYGTRLGSSAPKWLIAMGTFPRFSDPRDSGLIIGSPAFLDQMSHSASGLTLDATSALPVHPTQLYECALGLVLLAMTAVMFARAARRDELPRPGDVFAPAALTYGAGRLIIEAFRGDPERGFIGAVPAPALVAIACILCAAAVVVTRKLNARVQPSAPA